MSFFSRLFRKAPSAAAPVAPQGKPTVSFRVDAPPPLPDPAIAAAKRAHAAKDEEALKTAIASRDSQTLARLVIAGSSTRIRQLAAEEIDDPALLRQLIKDVRGGNDKSVYKILTRKRDADLAQSRQVEQRRAEIEAAAGAVERHSRRVYDPVYAATLDQYQTRWDSLAAAADPALQKRVQEAIDRGREVIAQHLRQIAVEASRELAAQNAAALAVEAREKEQKASAVASAAAAAEAAERARILDEERKSQAAKREAEQQVFRQIGGLLRKAQTALNEGSTGRASGLRRALEEKIAGAPPLPPHLTRQLELLDNKLNELKDWKSFTVGPKRLELIEEMESLIDATVEPQALADRIKTLQEDWRTLSRGAGESAEEEWQRFHQAAQKAYQPCKAYFEAQAQHRQENLQHRQALLDRLAAFEASQNWEQPDWRDVLLALRESRQEWRRYSAVDRAANKPLQQKFDALTNGLQARLDAEYERNLKAKRTLVDRTQKLLASEDSRAAIEEVKAIQQQWRTVGMVPRDEDQRLWEEFRQHCDAIFQKRQHESNEYTAALEANRASAVALCEELESGAALSGEELKAVANKVPELRAAFEALGEFPRSEARGLHNRFERAVERCDQAVERQRAIDEERGWSNLFDAANHVRAYRLSVARAADDSQKEALRAAAEGSIAGVVQGVGVLKKALASENGGDVAANEKVLRLLCVRAEIMTDTPTPAEDQGLRREYQVQRLMQSMGQGAGAGDAHLDTMALEWVSVGPTEEATYLELLERFKRCRERSIRP
jgi:hypothetical protein